jgi:hypothetical protein
MNNNDENEMIACAQTLRAAVNNEAEVTVTRRVAISNYNAAPVHDWCIYTGDILNKGKWKWECATGATLQGAFDAALAQIMKQGDERARDLAKLKESAAKLGLALVEVQP